MSLTHKFEAHRFVPINFSELSESFCANKNYGIINSD